MPLRIALVGCGKIADGHVEEIQKMPELAQIAAVCDAEPLMAEQLSVRYGIPRWFDNFERMLEEVKPDVVHITTPPQSHLSLATTAIDAGCHVYVEKPLTPTYQDSRRLVEYAERAGKKLTVGYSYYLDPVSIRAREMAASGELGDVVHVESFLGYNLAGPFGAALLADSSHWVHRLPGKLVQNNLDHILYKITDFFKEDNVCVKAFGAVRRPERFGDERDELIDELRVVLLGQETTAYATFSAHIRPASAFTRVYGTKKTIHIDYGVSTIFTEPSATLPSAIGRLLPPYQHARSVLREANRNFRRFLNADFQFFAGMNKLFRSFYHTIENDEEPPIAYRDILRISAIMDEIFRQVNTAPVEEVRAVV